MEAAAAAKARLAGRPGSLRRRSSSVSSRAPPKTSLKLATPSGVEATSDCLITEAHCQWPRNACVINVHSDNDTHVLCILPEPAGRSSGATGDIAAALQQVGSGAAGAAAPGSLAHPPRGSSDPFTTSGDFGFELVEAPAGELDRLDNTIWCELLASAVFWLPFCSIHKGPVYSPVPRTNCSDTVKSVARAPRLIAMSLHPAQASRRQRQKGHRARTL